LIYDSFFLMSPFLSSFFCSVVFRFGPIWFTRAYHQRVTFSLFFLLLSRFPLLELSNLFGN
jgi:hypothetical protein